MTEGDSTNELKKSAVAKQEEETLAFWQREGVFEKSLEQTKGGEPFTFYDGPPFATGQPHYGHLLTSIMKDAIPRYQTMRGRYVRRVWGWDCHGLPVENLIEKELGLEHKKDILELGIGKFNEAARASVMRFDTEWKKIIPRIGRWIDMEESYKTMDVKYTESIWWAFKTLYEKGLAYKGYKSMHICPRCETTLSTTEVADGYKDITDISVTVKFELVDEPGTFVLAWTTTPWTLPGNVALAVGEEIGYGLVESDGVRFVVAKDRAEEVFKGKEFSTIKEFKGKDLVGKSYKPIFPYFQGLPLENRENGWKIYAADFVTTESGTGVVHIAPAFGEDDMNLGKKENLPFVQHVSFDGRFVPEVKDFAGMYVKPKSDDEKERLSTDIAILKYLQDTGAYFSKEKITHSYPHCWRCDTPLLNYATSSWFIKVTALKEKLLELNQNVSWVPESIKDGRFGKWLENARDWSISRTRFWGAPLPVWECDTCDKQEVIGTFEELKEKNLASNTYIVMRHGEATQNENDTVSSRPENPHHLTDKGRAQVAHTAGELKKKHIDLIISSDFVRTKETAELVAKEFGISLTDVIYDERLREINAGVFEGKTWAEYHATFKNKSDRFTLAPEGGETLVHVKERVGELLYELEQKYKGKTILLVSHGLPLMSLIAISKGLDRKEILEFDAWGNLLATGEAQVVPFVPLPHNAEYELDVHRPYIDEVKFACSCGGTMKRIPEVFDCWVESGSMPFAQFHYTGDDNSPEGKLFRKNFPADFISEGLDQTRGWFYTMLVMGAGLFEKAPYKNVIVNGLILAEDGRKMSKRLKNYPDIADILNIYGADAMRLYMLSSPIVHGEDLSFSERGVDEVLKKVILRTENVLSFYELYRDDAVAPSDASENVLDRWIVARLAETAQAITQGFDSYEFDRAARPVALFVDDLSTWYLRRSRDRFKSGAATASSALLRGLDASSTVPEGTSASASSPRLASDAVAAPLNSDESGDARAAQATLRFVLGEFAKLIAPVMPFLAERVYAQVGGEKQSVHLEAWPKEKQHDAEILSQMDEVRRIVSLGLEARAKAGIKVRQPLAELRLNKETLNDNTELALLITDEVNVKSIAFDIDMAEEVSLDTMVTPELKQEGQFRDLVRAIQDARKKGGLKPGQEIVLTLNIPDAWKAAVESNRDELMRTVSAKSITYGSAEGGLEVKSDDATLRVLVASV
ncbi:MAG: hypothetical protein A2675_00890 [Candidatus Yonathbacteria bacterium RIFCSPHIGHO2_01_FULL_51_10]|uniref:Isoleucine--tRNA ligase n=1 Tax=Candidatus Yonathbacteria bacterium RIFCSPHIGHO2_01_FULL_51_10 TaxID=1802723 RepID=A0A1G2S940_9BACT|nr:MAG: hypothetical protein A2675_00890 [Candidatus Yonathbacteria bacterium RIFCSPHIGHO2_01_FULL_51_10]